MIIIRGKRFNPDVLGEDPLARRMQQDFDNLFTAGTPGGIKAQERAGQIASAHNETLPKQCPRQLLETLGFKFGADQDDLFVKVAFPNGWKKRAADHALYTDLLDDKDRKRGQIFYKAAFYDRRADMHLTRRYSTNTYWVCDESGTSVPYGKHTHMRVAAMDLGTVLQFFGEIRRDGAYSREQYDLTERLGNEADAWLRSIYPQLNDVMAYWD